MISNNLTGKYPCLLLTLMCLLGVEIGQPLVRLQQAEGSKTATGKPVYVQSIPASWAVVRDVQGGYEMHPQVFEEMMKYVGANFRAVGACFGIYPMDPDAVKRGTLRWQVGVRVTPGKPLGFGNQVSMDRFSTRSTQQLQRDRRQLKEPAAPYRLLLIESVEAAVVETSVAEAPRDGLSMFRWMAENGYVQAGPTRMEYLSHEGPPTRIGTRIIVPVQKRTSGLSVPGD